MKKAFVLLCVAIFAQTTFASPLIFKTVKTVESYKEVDLVTLDATKYRQLRIFVQNVDPKAAAPFSEDEALLYIDAIDEMGEVRILTNKVSNTASSNVLDTPPNRIRLTIKGFGTFKVFIWASQ